MEAVIFDLDGLLADTEIISLKVYQELLEDFGIPFTEETSQTSCGKTSFAKKARSFAMVPIGPKVGVRNVATFVVCVFVT